MSKFSTQKVPYANLSPREQAQWDFRHWRNFERFSDERKGDGINVIYYVHGSTDVMEGFSRIATEYLSEKIQ